MSFPPNDYLVEVLVDLPVEVTVDESPSYDMIVEFGTASISGLVAQQPEIVEVYSAPPVGGGYSRVEVLPFSKQGTLTTVTATAAEFPIMGGTFQLDSFAARVLTAPTGSSIILDILKNNVSVFSIPGNRPTIAAGQQNAVTTIPAGIMFVDGDYLEVQIVQVGSTTPGTTLTAAVRLAKIG